MRNKTLRTGTIRWGGIFSVLLLLALSSYGQTISDAAQEGKLLLDQGKPGEAVPHFRRALSLNPEDIVATRRIANALEQLGEFSEAVEYYRRAVDVDPDDIESSFALARVLSWRRETRAEAYHLYEEILRQHPNNTAVRMAYAEALSWEPRRRNQAVMEYEHVLQNDPQNRTAQAHLAMVWSWQGKFKRAEKLYDQILAEDAEEKLAVLGKGEVLTWSGRHFEAEQWLERLEKDDPLNPRLLLGRAGASLGIGRRERARDRLDILIRLEPDNPYARDLYETIEDWSSPQVETGFSFMRESGDPFTSRVDFNRPFLRVRSPAGSWSRLEFGYEPTDYFNRAARVRDHNFGIGWEGQPTDHLRFRTQIHSGIYDVGPTDFTGSITLGWLVNDRLQMDVGFTRATLVDSVQAASGLVIDGQLIGRVRSNLFEYNLGYTFPSELVDLQFRYSDGEATGISLPANRRLGFDFGAGKTFRLGEGQSMRLGYGFTFFGYDKDLSFFPNPNPTVTTGGYFSPSKFFNNNVQLNFSGSRNRWDYYFAGSLGVQQVETSFNQLDRKRLSSFAQTTQTIRLTQKVSLFATYEYLNVGGAFRRNNVSFGLRFYPSR